MDERERWVGGKLKENCWVIDEDFRGYFRIKTENWKKSIFIFKLIPERIEKSSVFKVFRLLSSLKFISTPLRRWTNVSKVEIISCNYKLCKRNSLILYLYFSQLHPTFLARSSVKLSSGYLFCKWSRKRQDFLIMLITFSIKLLNRLRKSFKCLQFSIELLHNLDDKSTDEKEMKMSYKLLLLEIFIRFNMNASFFEICDANGKLHCQAKLETKIL